MELAYRLIVEETPFIQEIRNNVITFITPVIEVDGREKQVDTYYYNKKLPPGDGTPAPDVLGQVRGPRQQSRRHGAVPGAHEERQRLLPRVEAARSCTTCTRRRRISTRRTGTGPYNDAHRSDHGRRVVDAGAGTTCMEMTKRGVPGVWTYGFYDGWTPNYMFFIAHTHNAIGRFYEVQSYGPDNYEAASAGDHHEPRVVPSESAAAVRSSGARATTRTSSSRRVLFSLKHVGEEQVDCTSRTTGSRTSAPWTRARPAPVRTRG